MSPAGRRTYEGRPLPRPDDELVDQGLRFDLGTVLSRRQALRVLGVGAAAAGLAACTDQGGTPPGLVEIADETAGPFPADGTDGPRLLAEDGVVRGDIRSSFGGPTGTADGVPMELELVVRDLAAGGRPFAGVAVYVWHCDREARYSLYDDGVTQENYLRGVQVAGADGTVRFTSVFPACYPGRWPHVHLEVYPDRASLAAPGSAVATSQVALPRDVCEAVYATPAYASSRPALAQVSLASDGVFGEDEGATQLATVTGDAESGYLVRLEVGVDTRTPPSV